MVTSLNHNNDANLSHSGFVPTTVSSTGSTGMPYQYMSARGQRFSYLGWDTGFSCVWAGRRAVKAGQLVPNYTIFLKLNIQNYDTSNRRQIMEHADVQEDNGQVRCRIIYSSFLISFLYLHKRLNRTSINDQQPPWVLRAGYMSSNWMTYLCVYLI